MPQLKKHAPSILSFLSEFGAATSRQLLCLMEARTGFGYRILRSLQEERKIWVSPLDPHLGSTSQRVITLREVGEWDRDETRLQLADAWLQAHELGWKWIPHQPIPWVARRGSEMPLVSAAAGDDDLGMDASIRIRAVAEEHGKHMIAYTDSNRGREARVRDVFSGPNGIRVITPWRHFRARVDPRRDARAPQGR